MKNVKVMIKGLSTLALLLSLANCGSSGSSNDGTTYNPYGNCGSNQNCYDNYFSQYYGPNSGGYYTGTQYYPIGGQQVPCQTYQIPQYYSGCNGGCGTQQYVVVPSYANGYYNGYDVSGGGGFYISGSFSW